MPILAFLLRKRERAAVLLRYGKHLSPMLVKLVRDLVPDGMEAPRVKETFDDLFTDDAEDEDGEPGEIKANVLEYSSDMLRLYVDQGKIRLPWDIDMLREFQGQTYVVSKSNTDAYGKKQFSKGKFHALDAARMAILGHLQEKIDAMREVVSDEPVLDMFMAY